MARFTSKPVSIEAVQYTGSNAAEVEAFGAQIQAPETGGDAQLWVAKSDAWCALPVGQWVMKEPDGSGFYPCDPDIFEARWAPEDDGEQVPPMAHGQDLVEVYHDGTDAKQPWRWRKWSAGNHKKIASGGESFSSESAAIQSAMRANPGVTVRVNNGG